MVSVTVIIPTRYSASTSNLFDHCVKTLQRSAVSRVRLRIIVVTTIKESAHILRARYPDLTIILAKPSCGFSHLNNLALAKSLATSTTSQFHLFINDDAFVAPNFFEQFALLQQNERTDIFVPLIFNPQKKVIDSFGVEYFSSGYAKNSISRNAPTTLASAACVLVRTSTLKKIFVRYGYFFNPLLFYYLEDVEFFIRARMLGARIGTYRQLKAFHYGSSTSGEKSEFVMFQTYRNTLWVLILTWPLTTMVQQIGSILLVQGWMWWFSVRTYGMRFYLRILQETLDMLPALLSIRRRNLKVYSNKNSFSKLLSPYAFRTYHGKTIPILKLW